MSVAAKSVAKVPSVQSMTPNGDQSRLEIKHPTASPAIASGQKNGSIVSASASLTCMAPKENIAKGPVKTTYAAAMADPLTIFLSALFFTAHSSLYDP